MSDISLHVCLTALSHKNCGSKRWWLQKALIVKEKGWLRPPLSGEITPFRHRACVFGLLRRVPYCHHQCGGGGGGGWLRVSGRAADEELRPPGGGTARRALLRATESSRLTPCWSLSSCLWRSSFFRSVGSLDSHAQSLSHRSSVYTIGPYWWYGQSSSCTWGSLGSSRV